MAKARFIYNNRWRNGTIGATLTSENPQHPATDTQIDTKTMFWRSTNDTDDPTLLPCDLGAEYDIDFVSLLGHNIPDTATIYFEGADDEDFSGGDLETIELVHNADNIFQFITSFKKQWVRIRITTPGNDDNYIQIATVICGKYFEPNCNFDWKYTEGDIDPSEISYSDSMVIFVQEKDEIFRGKYLFASLDDTAVVSVQELITLCGIHKAFIICFDYTSPNTQSRWVRLSGISRPKHVFYNIWSWDCPIEEII